MDVIGLILDGAFDRDGIRECFVDQRGIALSKPLKAQELLPSPRPIGIVLIFTRLASSWLVNHYAPHLRDLLDDDCLGFRTPGGAETVALLVQAQLRAHAGEDFAYLHTDLKNAFNELSRDAPLALLDGDLWFLKPLLSMVLGHDSMVRYGSGVTIANREGLIQGMPEAAVLFEVAIQPSVAKVRERNQATQIVGAADDHHLLGALRPLLAAMKDFLTTLQNELGLRGQLSTLARAHQLGLRAYRCSASRND